MLQDVTQKLLQESTKAPSSPAHSAGMGEGARQESDTLAQLLRSENNVLMAQRRSLAEEAQALKVAREQLAAELAQAQDELEAIRATCQAAQERAQESDAAHTQVELELRSSNSRLELQNTELQETKTRRIRTIVTLAMPMRVVSAARGACQKLSSRAQQPFLSAGVGDSQCHWHPNLRQRSCQHFY